MPEYIDSGPRYRGLALEAAADAVATAVAPPNGSEQWSQTEPRFESGSGVAAFLIELFFVAN